MTTVTVGTYYGEAHDNRKRQFDVSGATIELRENYWTETDHFDECADIWAITVRLHISDQCGTTEEVMTNVNHMAKIVGLLDTLNYELHDMMEPGVAVYHKPATR